MRVNKNTSGRKNEQGVIITLVAVFVLFVLGAMAALSIDVVTFYSTRSEAQLAADGAALAGARVLANSGATSDTGLMASAETLARMAATQVAASNSVGGRNLIPGGPCAVGSEISVCFSNGNGSTTDPLVTVAVQRTDVPTFFARIWGKTTVTVGASATAEAYNPSQANSGSQIPVAPLCVKPWLLPNIDPTSISGNPIFVTNSGSVNPGSNLLGWSINNGGKANDAGLPQRHLYRTTSPALDLVILSRRCRNDFPTLAQLAANL